MFSRKGLVDRAISFKGASAVPFWETGSHIKNSDILTYDLSLPDLDDPTKSEWGFVRQKRADGLLTIPEEEVLGAWKEVDAYEGPALDPIRRLSGIVKAASVCEDRYRLATLSLSGFAVYRALRGAAKSAVDALIEPERFLELMELIFEIETKTFDMIARKGFHGIEFRDDWGDRQTSRMTLSLWRKLLKHRYAIEFHHAKELGLHIWFSGPSSCVEFFGDLKEIGVDVVRLGSPYEVDVASIGRLYRGKLAFAVCLDEMIDNGTIQPEPYRQLRDCLSEEGNGFIGQFTEAVQGRTADKIINALKKID